MRLAMMRVGSGGREEPIATRLGTEEDYLAPDSNGWQMSLVPLLGPSSFKRRQGALPKETGPNVVATVAAPGRRYFSDLWTLLIPLLPPGTC